MKLHGAFMDNASVAVADGEVSYVLKIDEERIKRIVSQYL